MSNPVLQINYSNFDNIYDNKVKPVHTSWNDFADFLVAGHPVVSRDKLLLPSFSAWRYKRIDDPTIDHGTDPKTGKPLKRFSATHVRRLKSNLVEMSMLVIDFDGGMAIDSVQSRFGEYEYTCSTSLRHRFEDKDRFRVVFPLATPMPREEFQRLYPAIAKWINDDGRYVADEATYVMGQVFVLPAVYEGDIAKARAWRNTGKLLDWRVFESSAPPVAEGCVGGVAAASKHEGGSRLLPDAVLDSELGPIVVREIDRKISKVRCPFHPDPNPTEFVAVSEGGLPYLVCKKCGTIYMKRPDDDGIESGLHRIAERKCARAMAEPK
ncbi:hypothetical protein [Burkholderia pseudomallei]|uniref:hypothetical protein n=1 Tax=Burkholderia pseudomallei TaxID=28450 RepID=UPI0009C4331E|nr:hypothetical protein [Burkholderia pseudomallei]ONA10948.1 hypothetical protein AQ875_21465 [Burkholderia pseudomallei]